MRKQLFHGVPIDIPPTMRRLPEDAASTGIAPGGNAAAMTAMRALLPGEGYSSASHGRANSAHDMTSPTNTSERADASTSDRS